jgi:hypothetical protein
MKVIMQKSPKQRLDELIDELEANDRIGYVDHILVMPWESQSLCLSFLTEMMCDHVPLKPIDTVDGCVYRCVPLRVQKLPAEESEKK